MATDTGKGSRKGAVKDRTQTENPKTGDYAKRDRDHDSSHEGEFMANKQGGEKFKGVAEEPDKRRKGGS